MNIDFYKNKVKELVHKSCGFKNIYGYIQPSVNTIDENGDINSIQVSCNDKKGKEEVVNLLHHMADKGYKCLSFIMDAYRVQNVELKDLPDSLKDYKDHTEAVVCFLYTQEETWYIEVLYSQKNGKYHFMYGDWTVCPEIEGLFKNPYK